ncbi:MAG: sigma-70 family RNA polymerase sigma factor [Clostridia bacterium]|nr:sigma-70 family RNA polymerase sigma factor [Clostridia bacterium]
MINLSDNDLVLKVRENNEEATDILMNRYKTMVKKICRGYFLIGGESEDLIQEGMIGLYKACKSYDLSSSASFKSFAFTCILRQVKSALRKDNRLKNKPLNSGISLNIDGDDDEEVFIVPLNELSPEEKMIQQEVVQNIRNIIDSELSKVEKNSINLFLEGLSYSEIASSLNTTSKSVENALFRARNKIINKLKNN